MCLKCFFVLLCIFKFKNCFSFTVKEVFLFIKIGVSFYLLYHGLTRIGYCGFLEKKRYSANVKSFG